MDEPRLSYKEAGVDIDAANRSVDMIKKWVKKTSRPEVLSGIGSFGGLFALDLQKYREPILVSGTDGVGTKLRIAQMVGVHDSVGVDLVAMCVNDILAHGAEPLFFLDYIAIGKLDPVLVESLVKGISQGCLQAGCSLIGGETAEMPGFYRDNEYDLAGFSVGAVERSRIINGSTITDGDLLLALPSSGLHSNGYSLARKVLLENAGMKLEKNVAELGRSLAEELLSPTRIYVPTILALLEACEVKGLAHITGGGIVENLQRIIPPGLGAVVDSRAIESPAIFALIERLGNIDKAEMFRTFNMGIGYIIAISPLYYDDALNCLHDKGEKPILIGRVSKDKEKVIIE